MDAGERGPVRGAQRLSVSLLSRGRPRLYLSPTCLWAQVLWPQNSTSLLTLVGTRATPDRTMLRASDSCPSFSPMIHFRCQDTEDA